MAQSKEFVDGSHALNELSHVLAMLEFKNSLLQGAVDDFSSENAKLRERVAELEELTDEKRYIPQEWYARLKDDNAKLQKLLTFYLGCLTKGHVNCDSCAISGDGDCGHGRMVIDKARELGVEATDG